MGYGLDYWIAGQSEQIYESLKRIYCSSPRKWVNRKPLALPFNLTDIFFFLSWIHPLARFSAKLLSWCSFIWVIKLIIFPLGVRWLFVFMYIHDVRGTVWPHKCSHMDWYDQTMPSWVFFQNHAIRIWLCNAIPIELFLQCYLW